MLRHPKRQLQQKELPKELAPPLIATQLEIVGNAAPLLSLQAQLQLLLVAVVTVLVGSQRVQDSLPSLLDSNHPGHMVVLEMGVEMTEAMLVEEEVMTDVEIIGFLAVVEVVEVGEEGEEDPQTHLLEVIKAGEGVGVRGMEEEAGGREMTTAPIVEVAVTTREFAKTNWRAC